MSVSGESDLARAAFEHFSTVLGLQAGRAFTMDLNSIGHRSFDLSELEAPFSADEIWEAIKKLPSGKSPGPDGFTAEFLRSCWDTIKQDICDVFDKLYSLNGRAFQRLNEALITLIPKKPDASTLFDYRPISLIHLVAKLFAKVLSLRLGPRLGELVSTNQSAFIAGRSVHDNFILVQQTARHLHRLKLPRVLLKLDIARAFDSVSWPFLLQVLEHLGFGPRWREWISILISTASTRVMINGVPGPPIDHHQGLRQGDPVSPMLFTLVIDTLNTLFQCAVANGVLRRLTDRQAASSISLFVDDVVIFFHPDLSELGVVSSLLDYYGAVSGLRTNFAKCQAAPIQCTPDITGLIGSTLDCPVTTFPIKYLGLPLSLRKVPASQLLPLIDKLLCKLATWKAALLSRGERLALVRQVLCAMPVHILLAMALSPPILKKANRIIRDFLWHGRKDARAGCCLVSWARVCRPLELGGLGIRDLHRVGISLRVRWLWLHAADDSRPWSHLQPPSDPESLQFFRASTTWTVGRGTSCRFWTDRWLDGHSILDTAPNLTALVPTRRRRTRTVAAALHDRTWIRDIQGSPGPAAILEYVDLWRRLQTVSLTHDPDTIRWKWTENGVYSASSCYNALFLGSTTSEHWRLVWKSGPPCQ